MIRAAVLVVIVLAACDRGGVRESADYADIGTFDTTAVRIVTLRDTFVIKAELAATPEQQQLGLMERTSLPENAGMLFVYDEVQDTAAGFWMFRTRIPLDIAFVDSAGRIVTIRNMPPCMSPNSQLCPSYFPSAPYLKALEVNNGYFARNGIMVGATVEQVP